MAVEADEARDRHEPWGEAGLDLVRCRLLARVAHRAATRSLGGLMANHIFREETMRNCIAIPDTVKSFEALEG